VLDDIGQRLRHHVIHRHLKRLGQPAVEADIQLDPDRRTMRQRRQRRFQTILGEGRRVKPPRDLLQLLQRAG